MPESSSEPVARGIWSGSITFGLVSVPVEIYAATRRARAALRMLGPEDTPLIRQYVCPADGKVLAPEEIERGFEVAPSEFVIVTRDELDALAPRRSRDISLERFVPRDAIDPDWCVRVYFLVPGGEQTKAYRLLAETMQSSGRAAIASFVMRGRSHAVAIVADRGILRAVTLRFADELRSAGDLGLPEAGEVDAKKVEEMTRRVEALAAPELDVTELQDVGTEKLVALARQKLERGEGIVLMTEPAAGEAESEEDGEEEEGEGRVLDLMALIKQRMAARRGQQDRRPSGRRAGSGDLERASKHELYERARELGIEGRSKMTRDELLAAVRHAS